MAKNKEIATFLVSHNCFHPQMKILLSFTLPQVVPKPAYISFFCSTRKKIFWTM